MKTLNFALAASAAIIAGLYATGASAQEDVKACFVYVGSATDGGWTQAHDIARQELEDTLDIETAYIENVPEGPDAERAIERKLYPPSRAMTTLPPASVCSCAVI